MSAADSVRYLHIPCGVSLDRIPGGRAPLLIFLTPLHKAAEAVAKNFSEEGYEVLLIDIGCENASSSALANPSGPSANAANGHSNGDITPSSSATNLASTISTLLSKLGVAWNKYTALLSVGLQGRNLEVVKSLNDRNADEGGISAYISYGPQAHSAEHLNELLSLTQSQHAKIPTLLHLSEESQEVLEFLTAKAQDGCIPHSALPFNPHLDNFEASLGPVEAKSLEVFTYPAISSQEVDWVYAFPFSHHTKGFAFPSLGRTTDKKGPAAAQITDSDRSAAAMSYTRTLNLLKTCIGPRFPLEQLWDRHTYYEFAHRSAAKTMKTMVSEPYVNHIACLTGGTGFAELSRFYHHHFIHASPPDTQLINISRTIGQDRIIDEMIFSCTHTTTLDYFLPGIHPTGKKLKIAMVGIVNLRGDKLAFESLYWDQANTLVQLGLLDPELSSLDKDITLPITGSQVAEKILNPYGVQSNTLMPNWKDSEQAPIPDL